MTASKTASCTIAPQRAWKKGLVGGAATVACMIAFQSVTASACVAAAGKAEASTIASIVATHRKNLEHLIGLLLSFGLRYDERATLPRGETQRRGDAGPAVPHRPRSVN